MQMTAAWSAFDSARPGTRNRRPRRLLAWIPNGFPSAAVGGGALCHQPGTAAV